MEPGRPVTNSVTVHELQSTDDARDALRDAMRTGTPLYVAGAGTWAGAGAPCSATTTLSMRGLTGITEYIPGDLTITALAGTSLAELSHATATHGQWIGLDPHGSRYGTIGATIATGSSGPLAHAFGSPRDLMLGLEAVTGYGEVVSPGGRVVKNVAGFDLVRLYTGSWGTLGPITKVTLRLRALPRHDITRAIALHDPRALDTLLPLLRRHTVSLLACEWIDGATARALHVTDGAPAVLLRIGGNDSFVRGQLETLAPASHRDCDSAVWGALAQRDTDATCVVRYSGPVSEIAPRIATLQRIIETAGANAALHASLHRGVIRLIVHGPASDLLRQAMQPIASDPGRIVERLPDAWWKTEPDPFDTPLGRGIRDAFDPQRLCNPRRSSHG